MKFKQKIALSLCLFYVISVLGIALSMHFCGGSLASVSLYANEKGCKLCKAALDSKKDDRCCKNTKVEIKVKDSHKAAIGAKLAKLFATDLFLSPSAIFWAKPTFSSVMPNIGNKAPPLFRQVSIYLLNCVFRN